MSAFSRCSLGRRLRRCSISGAASNTTASTFGHLFIFLFTFHIARHWDRNEQSILSLSLSQKSHLSLPYKSHLSLPHKSHLSLPHLMRQSFDHHHYEKPKRATWQSSVPTFHLWITTSLCSTAMTKKRKIVDFSNPCDNKSHCNVRGITFLNFFSVFIAVFLNFFTIIYIEVR